MHRISLCARGIHHLPTGTSATSHDATSREAEHSPTWYATFSCFHTSSLSSELVVVVTDTDILHTPISLICLCTCFRWIPTDSVLDMYRRKEMFYLTTHSTHFIYGYMVSNPIPALSWSLGACIMSTGLVIKLKINVKYLVFFVEEYNKLIKWNKPKYKYIFSLFLPFILWFSIRHVDISVFNSRI